MAIKTKLADLAQRFIGWRGAIAEVNDEDRRLREQHAAAVDERERILTSWWPIDEAVENMKRAFDTLPGENAEALVAAFSRPEPSLEFLFRPLRTRAEAVPLFLEAAKITYERRMRSAVYEAGPPVADRPRLLAAVDERIASIEGEHEQLVVFARSQTPPIGLEFLPTVQARRDAKDEQDQKAAEAAKARQPMETRANDWHAARRVQPSPYLAENASSRRRGVE